MGANAQVLQAHVISNVALIDFRIGSYYGTNIEPALLASGQKVLSW